MVVQSAYNVTVPVSYLDDGRPEYYALFNTLAGVIDVIDRSALEGLWELAAGEHPGARIRSDGLASLSGDTLSYLDRRGYLFSSRAQEQRSSRLLYDKMLHFHRQVVRQPLVAIPSYNCDLKCPYCWQRLYHMDSPIMSEAVADHLFEVLPQFVEVDDPERIDFVVFGGEPLQDIPLLRERVLHLLRRAREKGFSTKIISNGVGLAPNVPYIKGKVDLIQVTIDGPPDVHIKRRPLPTGDRDSFTPMAEGITRAIEANIRINVRVNTDDKNLERLPELADYAKDAGWLDGGLVRFHLAPVKNHNPRKTTNSESTLLLKVLNLVKADDRMSIFDLTGFPGIKYFQGFKEAGLFSLHRFFNCEAQINFYAFDLHGDVYSCWDAAGLKHLSVGTFHPQVQLKGEELDKWRKRTSLDIEGCQGCGSSPHCGGGCQFLAFEHAGAFEASSCDSMMEGYVQAITENRHWLMERARAADHAVGLISAQKVLSAIDRPFGIVEVANSTGPLAANCS
ncbi:MAG: SPASM domain-containing protein [Vitreimonas sp.]